MIGLLWSILAILISPCRSNARLEAENAVLRHQLLVLRRKCRGRVRLTNFDRWIFVQLYQLFPSVLQVLHVIRPETLVRWHRAGFRSYWRWKSRNRGGRPQIDTDLRALIRQMTLENPLCWGGMGKWGALRAAKWTAGLVAGLVVLATLGVGSFIIFGAQSSFETK